MIFDALSRHLKRKCLCTWCMFVWLYVFSVCGLHVCVCVCVSVRDVSVFMCVRACVHVQVGKCLCLCVFMCLRAWGWEFEYMCVHLYVRSHVSPLPIWRVFELWTESCEQHTQRMVRQCISSVCLVYIRCISQCISSISGDHPSITWQRSCKQDRRGWCGDVRVSIAPETPSCPLTGSAEREKRRGETKLNWQRSHRMDVRKSVLRSHYHRHLHQRLVCWGEEEVWAHISILIMLAHEFTPTHTYTTTIVNKET